MREDVERLSEALTGVGTGYLVVVTGAGISLASGIPTFRGTDEGAIWKHDILEMGTFRFFQANPEESWRWYLSRFDKVLDARPNPAHYALAAIERWHEARGGRFLLVTQNVDTLHDAAGSRQLVEVHGRADRVRCPAVGCRWGAPRGSLARSDFDMTAFLADPRREHLPRCPECGSILRQHVLWFDEYYAEHEDYQWDRVQLAAAVMSLVLFVGTSFSVGVTELFTQQALSSGVPIYSIDPGAARPPYGGIEILRRPCEELLPAVCEHLGVAVPGGE